MSLISKTVSRFFIGAAVFGAVLFVPAGTWNYWEGWVYLSILLVPSLAAFGYFLKHDPEFVERRSRMKEKVREQKVIVAGLYLCFIAGFLVAGFDHRFHWSHPPFWSTVLSQAIVGVGFITAFWALKVNRYAARTIEVETGQQVISSGPYRMVRHPMYSGACLMFLATPLALGSYVAALAFLLIIPLFVLRLLNEEKVLRQGLPGYSDYCIRTRFRLIPLMW